MTAPEFSISITNGAAYILEACMQDSGPCTTPNKIMLWNKVGKRIREQINRDIIVDGVVSDFEKPVIRGENESDLSFKKREIEFNESFKKWGDTPLTLTLREKFRDPIKEAVKFVIKNKDNPRARTRVDINDHWVSLISALDLGTDTEETEE
jgi:hypothetical protein